MLIKWMVHTSFVNEVRMKRHRGLTSCRLCNNENYIGDSVDAKRAFKCWQPSQSKAKMGIALIPPVENKKQLIEV